MKPTDEQVQNPEVPEVGIPIVGVGASAGGLKALQEFVRAVPPDSGMAYVVVLHLDPDRESRMAALLQNRSSIPVTQVTGSTKVEPDHIYVAPPDRDMEMQGSTIRLRKRGARSKRVPIDVFFRTLAESAGAEATGVILSGTGRDGSTGIRAIREAGGITVAQSPEEADFDGMPSNAIATGLIDLVIPASQVPSELIRLRDSVPLLGPAEDEIALEDHLEQIFTLLRSRTGHDFALYKQASILRRVKRRLLANDVPTLGDYVLLLQANEKECKLLMQDLLISVSSFFRDPEEFTALARLVPKLFRGKDSNDTVRIWVAGSATGEEAYTLAIILEEHAATLEDPPRLQLFATDIDEKGHTAARAGFYPPDALAHMTPKRLERFFSKEAGGYRVRQELREMVLFALHNVLLDPPFSKVDLISCRNLFIYLKSEAQVQLLETFHSALNKDGILFLGSSESAGNGELFEPVASNERRIFRRRETSRRVVMSMATADPLPGGRRTFIPTPPTQLRVEVTALDDRATQVSLLEKQEHPGIVVDDQHQVVHLSDGAGRFVGIREGKPSRRLRDLAPKEIWSALRSALRQVFEDGESTVRRVQLTLNGVESRVTIYVQPGEERGKRQRFALILFHEESGETKPQPRTPPRASGDEREADLQEKLERAQDDLASMRTTHDRTMAELRTANEDLRSLNEEQKAVGEELSTGREELQAGNEELASTNQELQSAIEELQQTNADLKNLIESTEIGTIFVDRDLRIRRFTPPVARIFNFVDRDRGRNLSDITHRLRYPHMMEDLKGVLQSQEPVERETETEAGEWFVVRMNPYRSHDDKLDGAVITLFDHTDYHRIQKALHKATKMTEAANRAEITSLSSLFSQLRGPLGSVMAGLETLQLGNRLSHDQEEAIQRMGSGVARLVSMIETLPDLPPVDGSPREADVESTKADTKNTEVKP